MSTALLHSAPRLNSYSNARRSHAIPHANAHPSECVVSSEPICFFTMLHAIEDRISKEATAIFAARGWQGALGMPDWLEAQARLLKVPLIRQLIYGDSLVVWLHLPDYQANDLTFQVQADRLYVCALKQDGNSGGREGMVSVKLKLPFVPAHSGVEASLQDDWLTVRLAAAMTRKVVQEEASLGDGHWIPAARAAA